MAKIFPRAKKSTLIRFLPFTNGGARLFWNGFHHLFNLFVTTEGVFLFLFLFIRISSLELVIAIPEAIIFGEVICGCFQHSLKVMQFIAKVLT